MRRSGSARNVPRNMQFSQIGKLIVKFVAPESTNATVELSSPGNTLESLTSLSLLSPSNIQILHFI